MDAIASPSHVQRGPSFDARVILPQIPPFVMETLSGEQRLRRFEALVGELYGARWRASVSSDLRVGVREVCRWAAGDVQVPKPVLVALGAMLAVRRAEAGIGRQFGGLATII